MEEQGLAAYVPFMFIMLFRLHLKDIFNPVFASHCDCKPFHSACRQDEASPLVALQTVVFCRMLGLYPFLSTGSLPTMGSF